MVAEISSFLSRGHDTVPASNCGECTLFCRVLPLRNDHGIIDRNPRLLYMMPHFNANEQQYAFVFPICDFDNHALCDSYLNRSKVKGHQYIIIV